MENKSLYIYSVNVERYRATIHGEIGHLFGNSPGSFHFFVLIFLHMEKKALTLVYFLFLGEFEFRTLTLAFCAASLMLAIHSRADSLD